MLRQLALFAFLLGLSSSGNGQDSEIRMQADLGVASEDRAVFSPDGSVVLTFGQFGLRGARLWDMNSGRLINRLGGASSSISSARFLPGGAQLITGGMDGFIRIWQIKSGQQIRSLFAGKGLSSLAVSENGFYLLTANHHRRGRIQLWDLRTTQLLRSFPHQWVTSIAWYQGEQRIASADSLGTIKLWNVSTGKHLADLKHPPGVSSITVLDAREELLSISREGGGYRWSLSDAKNLGDVGIKGLTSAAFIPDGNHIVGVATVGPRVADQTTFWDLATSVPFRTIPGRFGALSQDGRYLLTFIDSAPALWDTKSGAKIHQLSGGFRERSLNPWLTRSGREIILPVRPRPRRWSLIDGTSTPLHADTPLQSPMDFSPSAERGIAVDDQGVARLWNLRTSTTMQLLPKYGWTAHLSFSDDGSKLLVGDGLTAQIWNTSTGEIIHDIGVENGWVASGVLSSDARYVLTGTAGRDSNPRLWALEAQSMRSPARLLRLLKGHTAAAKAVAFSSDSHHALTGGVDQTARLWNVASGRQLRVFRGHTKQVTAVAFSPDGKHVLTGSNDSTVRLWDLATGKTRKIYHLPFAVNRVSQLSSTELVFWDDERQLSYIWQATTGRLAPNSNSLGQQYPCMSFVPERKWLIVCAGSDAVLLDMRGGTEVRRWRHEIPIARLVIYRKGRNLAAVTRDGDVHLWDLATDQKIQRFAAHRTTTSAMLSSDGNVAVTTHADYTAYLWDARTGNEVLKLQAPVASSIVSAILSLNGRYLLTGTSGYGKSPPLIWQLENKDGRISAVVLHALKGHSNTADAIAFSADSRYALTGSSDHTARLWDVITGQQIRRFRGHSAAVTAVAFSPDVQHVLTASVDDTVRLWDRATGKCKSIFDWKGSTIVGVGFAAKGDVLIATNSDGDAVFWKYKSDAPFLSATAFKDGAWVFTSQERFDTDSLESKLPINWLSTDDPIHPLPLELFMRDYYEPQLVQRLLAGEELKKVPSIRSLNRVQPLIEISELEWHDADLGLVSVNVKLRSSGDVYDLRLFRDGQLVGWAPHASTSWQAQSAQDGPMDQRANLLNWREAHLIEQGQGEVKHLEADGAMLLRFDNIRLPRRAGQKQVVFTAYAFNEDRVKSTTASKTLDLPSELPARKGKAYVISVGVNRTQSSPAWDLNYAARDARELSRAVSQKLRMSGQLQVVSICLVSDEPTLQDGEKQQCTTELPASKEHLKATLDLLAGRKVRDSLRRQLLKSGTIERAQPEDLVLISVSSHGYTDSRGTFHFVLADVNEPQQVTEALDRSTLNTNELSDWLRDVDAGELVMIVDACQSEATIKTDGFKPGPMGSRGLGQLAYDKGMRVLAASKAKESAFERGRDEQGRDIRQGLLSYALVKEGLDDGSADWQPQDNRITISEWLAYAEQAVPKLFAEGHSKRGVQRRGAPEGTRDGYLGTPDDTPAPYQQPTLFDFRKGGADTVLIGNH